MSALRAEVSASESKSRFLDTVSHEIRTPLTTILGYTEILMHDKIQSQEDVRETLLKIERSSRHLLAIVNDCLDFSKIEKGMVEAEREIYDLPFAISTALEQVVTLVKPTVSFTTKISLPGVRCVIGDSHRLIQIIVNLVSNACKFTEEGEIRLEVGLGAVDFNNKELEIVFELADTGIGIEEHNLLKLFKPFSQADSSMTRRYGGTGLGLCITKQLVQLLGGDIGVESQLGVGTKFRWSIMVGFTENRDPDQECHTKGPIHLRHAMSEDENSPVFRSKSNGEVDEANVRVKVLLVEDNKLNQALVKTLLERLGCEVATADDGVEAILKERKDLFDVILMDFQMPVLDGIEATRRLKDLGCLAPIIGISANAAESTRKEAFTAGMNGVLSKPIRSIDLKIAIEKALNMRIC